MLTPSLGSQATPRKRPLQPSTRRNQYNDIGVRGRKTGVKIPNHVRPDADGLGVPEDFFDYPSDTDMPVTAAKDISGEQPSYSKNDKASQLLSPPQVIGTVRLSSREADEISDEEDEVVSLEEDEHINSQGKEDNNDEVNLEAEVYDSEDQGEDHDFDEDDKDDEDENEGNDDDEEDEENEEGGEDGDDEDEGSEDEDVQRVTETPDVDVTSADPVILMDTPEAYPLSIEQEDADEDESPRDMAVTDSLLATSSSAVPDTSIIPSTPEDSVVPQKRPALEARKTSKEKSIAFRASRNRKGKGVALRSLDQTVISPTIRRSARVRIEPLKFWKGEKKQLVAHGDAIEIIRASEDESAPKTTKRQKLRGNRKAVLRQRHTRKTTGDRDPYEDDARDADVTVEESVPEGSVVDFVTGEEKQQAIAITADMIRPRPVNNQKFLFQKTFSEGSFMTCGVLVLPKDTEKPNRNSDYSSMVFHVVYGCVQATVHKSTFTVRTGGHFSVPRGNQYRIKNVAQREARLFFCQGREVQRTIVNS